MGQIILVDMTISLQTVSSFNNKMSVHPPLGWSPGKTHKIKLFEKDIIVNLSYSSPQKAGQKYQELHSLKQSPIKKDQKEFTLRYRSKKKKEIVRGRPQEKQFYLNKIDESHNILSDYEQFQRHIIEKKTKKRLKVYSNSKTQEQEFTPPKYLPVPIKTINLKECKHQTDEHNKIQLTKRTLHSSKKVENRHIRNPTAIIRLYQNKNTYPCKEEEMNNNKTPSKTRTRKIEVVSSRRRKKNDSILSRGADLSIEFVNNSSVLTRRNQRSEERGEPGIVNSFNTSVLH